MTLPHFSEGSMDRATGSMAAIHRKDVLEGKFQIVHDATCHLFWTTVNLSPVSWRVWDFWQARTHAGLFRMTNADCGP